MIKRKHSIAILMCFISVCMLNGCSSVKDNTTDTVAFTESMVDTTESVSNTYDKTEQLENEMNIIQEQLQTEIEKNKGLSEMLGKMKYELEAANTTLAELKSEEYEFVYLGDFMLTSYCACVKCCDQYAINRPVDENGNPIVYTASGTVAEAGRTIGVDPSVIPYGTKVYIQNLGWYVAEDTGAGIKKQHIDIYANSHQEALALGVRNSPVWVLIPKS